MSAALRLRHWVAAGVVLLLLHVASRVGLLVVIATLASSIILLNHLASRDLRRVVDGKCSGLGELSYEALVAKGAAESLAEYVTVGPRFMEFLAVLDVLAEQEAPHTVRVVVRGSTDVLFATLYRVAGFRKSGDGVVSPLPDHELETIDERDTIDYVD